MVYYRGGRSIEAGTPCSFVSPPPTEAVEAYGCVYN